MSLPPFFIALAALTLLLALVALWNSLRVVLGAAGGADEGGHSLASAELPDRAALLDEKKSLLRAIKDLEYEHAVGKIGEDDFLRLDQAYRLRAKEVLALLDADLAPYQARAEALLSSTIVVEKPAPEVGEAPADDEALRQRARALREEAERLERLAAAKTTKAPEEPAKASEEPAKASEEPAKASEEPAKASEEPAEDATVKPSEDA